MLLSEIHLTWQKRVTVRVDVLNHIQEAHRVLHLFVILNQGSTTHAQSATSDCRAELKEREQTNCVLTLSLKELFVCLESALQVSARGGGTVIANY